MSSSTAISDRETARLLLARANLPAGVGKLSQKNFNGRCETALAYLNSNAYACDYSDGKGICLYGNPAVRSDLFALIAKGIVLAERSVWFCTVHYLVSILDNGTEDQRSKIARVQNLFVDWFEKDFGNDGCPYTYMQRAEVEEFLAGRLRAGLTTNFSAWAAWPKLRWWSRDHLALFTPKIVDISI